MFKVCLLSAAMCAGISTSGVHAQDATTTPATPSYVAPKPYAPSWSDDGIATIASQLTGTWKSAEPIEGGEFISMSIAPVPIDGMSDTLYVESIRSSTPWEPYRQAIFQLYRYKDGIRLRTYDFALGDVRKGVFNAMWAAPELFPKLASENLIATLDVELQPTSSGFTGATPYPYPTGVSGAVEMTSSVTLDGDTLSVADRGFDSTGKVVWGADTDSVIRFERSEPSASTTRRDDGMVIIDYLGDDATTPSKGDQLHVHYDGYLSDGTRFDSSYVRNQPFVFEYPPATRAITGWGIGMDGFMMGHHRKLLIPGYMGYGDRGNPRANIPPNAMLIFNTFMAQIDHTEPAPPPEAQPTDSVDSADSKEDHSQD